MIFDFEGLTIDDLFKLHTELSAVLTEKLIAKKAALDKRLRRLHPLDDREITRARRPYPSVKAKFRNPDQPLETWSGRGRRPCWLIAQLKIGQADRRPSHRGLGDSAEASGFMLEKDAARN